MVISCRSSSLIVFGFLNISFPQGDIVPYMGAIITPNLPLQNPSHYCQHIFMDIICSELNVTDFTIQHEQFFHILRDGLISLPIDAASTISGVLFRLGTWSRVFVTYECKLRQVLNRLFIYIYAGDISQVQVDR
jgi:hypothetical protein